ncbi:molybdenum cofactor guanylyltransferase MobA [Pelomonas sp. KK5]|uniref:molybdenum cofactor guanylyltransferase MobA n=1 Tax=Pelomonas sp. KK5 TaxID=1855730 RepID=UPI00097BF038|nr:molybdenum cofactor guanylyltransferase MobA [Pelomonas sp. KK5]
MNRDITGLILAGGRGSRMGGVDKGLQLLDGRPLVEHVLARLRPQVGALLINANRHADEYGRYGCRVVADADASFAGPLAGMLAGLRAAGTEWLLAVPCDAPLLPPDLAARLATEADVAVPEGPDGRLQPVFCLLRTRLAVELDRYLSGGGRKVESWLLAQRHQRIPFDRPGDEAAFFNANTLAELRRLENGPHG